MRLSRADGVDLVLVDLGLPDSQGLTSLIKVRETNGDVPVVVLTGLEDEETGLKAIELGARRAR